MTVLAGIMMCVGFQAITFADMRSIWAVSGTGRWATAVTLLATLLTPIPVAAGLGVLLTMVVFILKADQSIEMHELVREDDGQIHVADALSELSFGEVTVLDVYGPLYFAAAGTMRERLPDPDSAENAAVVLRIRGNQQIGATFIEEVNDYAHELSGNGGRLYLCGMTEDLADRLERAHRLDLGDEVVLVPGTDVSGSSLSEALRLARQWVEDAGQNDDDPGDERADVEERWE